MKLFSAALLFFALIGPNLPALHHAGKDRPDIDRSGKENNTPESYAISGFRDVAADRLAKLLEARIPSVPKDETALVAKVCVSIWEGVVPLSMRAGDEEQREQVIKQLKTVFQRYLEPLGGP